MSGSPRRTFLLVVVLTALAAPASATTASRSPKAVLKALLTTRVAASALPGGFTSPVITVYTPALKARTNHALGGAEIDTNGGGDAVVYLVFPTAADARADWLQGSFSGTTTARAPRSIPKPSVEIDTSVSGTVKGKHVTLGLTDIASLQGTVIVQAATTSSASAKHGDIAGAVALELFAIGHLKSVG